MNHPDHWIDQQTLRRYAELAQDYKYHAIITGYPGNWRISLNALNPDGTENHDAVVEWYRTARGPVRLFRTADAAISHLIDQGWPWGDIEITVLYPVYLNEKPQLTVIDE